MSQSVISTRMETDFAVADNSNNISVLLATAMNVSACRNYAAGNDLNSIASGDFNGDGKLDLVASSLTEVMSASFWATATAHSNLP